MPSRQQIAQEIERRRAELDQLRRRRRDYIDLELRHAEVSPLRRYFDDPCGFVRNAFSWRDGEGPSPYQAEILSSIPELHRVAARGPHGLGKTAMNAWVILWFALTRDGLDWKVITTASVWRQLTVYLWPEVHKWARRLRPSVIGRSPLRDDVELLDLAIKLRTGQATAVASNDPEKIEGAHADHILYVFDEAKIIPAASFDAAEGALSTGDAYAIACSTPGEPSGRFYDICRRASGYEDWHPRHVTKAEAVDAGRVSADWCEKRKAQWGEQSAIYQNRVEGNFASADEDSVIPLAWIEAANARWAQWKECRADAPLTCVGVDVARGGADKTYLALRSGPVITELRPYDYADTMATTGSVVGVMRAGAAYAVVDVIGVGAGVVDRLREQGYNAVAFNAGERSEALDISGELGFLNKRSAAWWAMREFLDPANDPKIALPADDLLTGDLTAPKWRVTSSGKIVVESKDEIRKRIGRSTDAGDAVIQAFYLPPPAPKLYRVVVEDPGGDISPI
jgi:hypothetical protein